MRPAITLVDESAQSRRWTCGRRGWVQQQDCATLVAVEMEAFVVEAWGDVVPEFGLFPADQQNRRFPGGIEKQLMDILAGIEAGPACKVGERGEVYLALMFLPGGRVAHGVHVETGCKH